jgi:3-keto-5-aminohexanoate cleavage enzyme
VFHNPIDFLRELGRRMRAANVKPELEIFDSGQLETALRLADEGVLEPPFFFQLVLGVRGGAPATERALLNLVDQVPEGSPWSVCAIGRPQLAMNALAIVAGGHARTGLEDNVWFRRGEHASNPRLVERVRTLAETVDRPVASPAEARRILGLAERAGR